MKNSWRTIIGILPLLFCFLGNFKVCRAELKIKVFAPNGEPWRNRRVEVHAGECRYGSFHKFSCFTDGTGCLGIKDPSALFSEEFLAFRKTRKSSIGYSEIMVTVLAKDRTGVLIGHSLILGWPNRDKGLCSIHLEKGKIIFSGKVVDKWKKRPIPGIRVRLLLKGKNGLYCPDAYSKDFLYPEALTGKDGRFVIYGADPPRGGSKVIAGAPGCMGRVWEEKAIEKGCPLILDKFEGYEFQRSLARERNLWKEKNTGLSLVSVSSFGGWKFCLYRFEDYYRVIWMKYSCWAADSGLLAFVKIGTDLINYRYNFYHALEMTPGDVWSDGKTSPEVNSSAGGFDVVSNLGNIGVDFKGEMKKGVFVVKVLAKGHVVLSGNGKKSKKIPVEDVVGSFFWKENIKKRRR